MHSPMAANKPGQLYLLPTPALNPQMRNHVEILQQWIMERLRAGNSTNMQLKNRRSALLSTAIPWSEQYCTVVLDESSPALSQVRWNTSSSTSRRAAGGHMEEIRALNMAVESSQDEPGSLCRLYGQPVDAFIASDVLLRRLVCTGAHVRRIRARTAEVPKH